MSPLLHAIRAVHAVKTAAEARRDAHVGLGLAIAVFAIAIIALLLCLRRARRAAELERVDRILADEERDEATRLRS